MKKWMALLLMLLLALACAAAFAEEGLGNLRHEVFGDVSVFDVSDELDQGVMNPEQTQASLGTDVYLFVDPDTASYVTFYVTDENGNPIEGAKIYITYDDVTEFYGVTDKNGMLKTYLFRDVEYGYRVTKDGFETATGTFKATEETKLVHVVLRRLYELTIIVVDGDTPVPGVLVYVDGKPYTTDKEGKVVLKLPNGEYSVVIVTPDGRRIPLQAVVKGDTTIIVDIGADNAIIEGGLYADRFLVYNKLYNPEDYILTKYRFTSNHLRQQEGESAAAYEARVGEFLAANPSTILIEAQPERIQNSDGTDTDRIGTDGKPIYAQRSLMPTGYLLKAWEKEGFERLVFTNEHVGVMFDLDVLHGEKMTKLFALVQTVNGGGVKARDIATDAAKKRDLSRFGLTMLDKENIDVQTIDFGAIRDYEFAFDHEKETQSGREGHDILADTIYTNTLFEFRITPILPAALRAMVTDGMKGEEAMVKDSIMIASRGYFSEELRRWRADGRLTDAECRELYKYIVDGVLMPGEMKDLKKKTDLGILSTGVVDILLNATLDEKMYRLSSFIIAGGVRVNITPLMDGMETVWFADAEYDEELARLSALPQSVQTPDEAGTADLTAQAEQALEEKYQLMTVDNLGRTTADKGFTVGENTALLDAALKRTLPEAGTEAYDALTERLYPELTVDVRKEYDYQAGRARTRYKAYITEGTAGIEMHRALTAPNQTSGLAALVLAR